MNFEKSNYCCTLTVRKTVVCFMNLFVLQQINTIRASHGLIASYIIYVVVKLSGLSLSLSLCSFFFFFCEYVCGECEEVHPNMDNLR